MGSEQCVSLPVLTLAQDPHPPGDVRPCNQEPCAPSYGIIGAAAQAQLVILLGQRTRSRQKDRRIGGIAIVVG